jgi:hypothetical protein
MAEISRVPKNGTNKFHNYDYVMEGDLSDHVRPLLSKQGIGLTFSVLDVIDLPNNTIRVKAQITLGIDGGETISATVFGDAQDKGDKALYKAMTGAVKYWLYKTFLVSTGDDPEQQEAADPKGKTNDADQEKLRKHWSEYNNFKTELASLSSEQQIEQVLQKNEKAIKENSYKGRLYKDVDQKRASLKKAA